MMVIYYIVSQRPARLRAICPQLGCIWQGASIKTGVESPGSDSGNFRNRAADSSVSS